MTDHETWAELALERFLSDPDGIETLALARHGLRTGQWDDEYVAAIGQHGILAPTSWPEEQIAAFAELHSLIYSGSVAMVLEAHGVRVGAPVRPALDEARRERHPDRIVPEEGPVALLELQSGSAGNCARGAFGTWITRS